MVPRFPKQPERGLETLSLADLVEAVCRPEAGGGEVDFERQTLQMRLRVAQGESLREDVEYLRVCLAKIASFLTPQKGLQAEAEDHADSGKWLVPIPVSNPENGNLEMHMRTLILKPTQAGEADLQDTLRQFTDFSRVESQDRSGSWLNFPARVNLLKALTVFLDQMAARPAAAEEGLSVDYPKAARLLQKMDFVAVAEEDKEKLQSWREALQSFLLKKAGWMTVGEGGQGMPSDPSCDG